MVQQTKTTRKEGQAQGQRKVQQRQRLRELREQLQQQQLQRRKRQVQSTTGLGKEIHSKDNMDMAKEKDTTTKEKANDTTTAIKEEKEQKENKQQVFATDVGNQDTWPSNAERRSTTVTQEPLRLRILATAMRIPGPGSLASPL